MLMEIPKNHAARPFRSKWGLQAGPQLENVVSIYKNERRVSKLEHFVPILKEIHSLGIYFKTYGYQIC